MKVSSRLPIQPVKLLSYLEFTKRMKYIEYGNTKRQSKQEKSQNWDEL